MLPSGLVSVHVSVPLSCLTSHPSGSPSNVTFASSGTVYSPLTVGSNPLTGWPSALAVTCFRSSVLGLGFSNRNV